MRTDEKWEFVLRAPCHRRQDFQKGCNFLTDVRFSYYTKHHPARLYCAAHISYFNLNHFECVDVDVSWAWDQKLKQTNHLSIYMIWFRKISFVH